MIRRDQPSALVREIYERELSVEEFDEAVRASLANEEDMERQVELVHWFRTRYPTAAERLAYARRQYDQSMRRFGILRAR